MRAAGKLRPGAWVRCGVGSPGLPRQGQGLLAEGAALRPQPGQYIRGQLADADKALHAGNLAGFDQFQAARQARQAGQYANQEQLVVGVRFAPEDHFAVAVQLRQGCALPGLALFDALRRELERLQYILGTYLPVRRLRQRRHRPHDHGVVEHVEGTGKPGDAQAVLDIVAAAPMLHLRFAIGGKTRVAGGEIDCIGMGLELWPAGETGFAGDQPLGVGQPVLGPGQAKGAQLGAGFVVQGFQQALGALAQGGQVEQAVMAGCMNGGHANSLWGSVRRQAGSWNVKKSCCAWATPSRGPRAQRTPGARL